MGSIGFPEIAIIGLVVVVLFGAGRVADLGKGLGQSIRNFKEGLREEEAPAPGEGASAESTTPP